MSENPAGAAFSAFWRMPLPANHFRARPGNDGFLISKNKSGLSTRHIEDP